MPDADCFIPTEGIHQAYSSLAQCAIDGRGIGVMTAPAGLGKTLICQRLARELEGRFTVVFLPTANFLTRRSLLQAILFELGHSYVRMGDQELRLALTSVIRRLRPGRGTIALIVDEAHLLAPRMLEELRTLTNFADAGESLLRLVISGHLSLDETLSQPSMAAFNQRIGIQATLQSLTRDESAEYVSRRLALAGANVSDLLSDDALLVICEASDGSPRCLNQLCDHSLLLGYLSSQKPVSQWTVREALDDLKQLPLTWNEPMTRRGPVAPPPISTPPKPARTFDDEEAWIVTSDEPIASSAGQDEIGTLEFGEATESPISSRSQLAPAKPAKAQPARTFDDDDAWIVTPDEPSAADDEIGTLEFGDAAEPTISDSIEIGEPIVVTTPPMIESILTTTVSAGRTAMIQPVTAPISATMSISIANEVMDEEVVIDRYAALDAALNRLTRTMLCARAISRRNDSNPIGPAKPELIPIDDEDDSDSAAFDVVLPDEVASVATAAEKPRQESRLEPATTDKGSRLLSGRRYERLFSELRRRRIGA
jgi:type II secretory pathway predicted ATPase ExeA